MEKFLGTVRFSNNDFAVIAGYRDVFLGTVRFRNNDFAVIAGYGDVVNGSMTIKKVYYVEGLGHNLFSVGQFCDKGLEVAFRKSTCFVRNEDDVDLLIGDRSSNLYTVALNEIVQICLWINDLGCSKHMTGNRALLTNFVEKFFGTVCFGNNDFAVIAGYGDVVIGSMTIKKVYYVEGLGHNLFSVGQFCDKGLEVAFRKSTCFVRTKDGVDLLTGDRSSNLYTVTLNEVASNSSSCLLARASSSQSWLWHQRLLHLNFTTINNLMKNNLVQGLPKMKFKKDHLCSACEQGKIHQKHHKSKIAFALNKPLYLLHMDLYGPMRVESINEKQFMLVVVDDYSRYTWVFFVHSKDEVSEVIISFIKKTQVNLQLQVQRVRTDNGAEFKNKTLAKLFDEIMKSSTMNVETSNIKIPLNEEEVFHESSESFQEESSSSSLNDDV
nr:retrovirus-related Pol polyprotein from transposon TNT 1-94 [Tanacetum cinerariifolium]